ncbi:hypothetical protein SAMN04487944_109152 [Gracilibacillus ureilyticus]|uniref:Uncharacterized protein n=1 Tax=Gracilibacillus ureilyticus TaxID=531814 RepID=A0A1H9RSR7_9BACI|nr:hypothetical protein [Gracilibacillus ureilyticus]SER75991.1 hypothetical protein SAMN04487944_109152 [Gracilibacillus ureilyticus]
MEQTEQNLRNTVDQMVKESLDKYFKEFWQAEIINENGNSSVKQSGNGIVYVDNTGIAYAFMLFYQYFMKDQLDNSQFNQLLQKLDKVIVDNRNEFKKAMQDLK